MTREHEEPLNVGLTEGEARDAILPAAATGVLRPQLLRMTTAQVIGLARRANAWVEPLRLSVCILAGFLAIAGFILAGRDISWIAVAAVFFIAIATMLQNDWRDRFHDVRKGRTLAYEHQGVFLAQLVLFWAVSAVLVAFAAAQETRLGIALSIIAVAGVVYSETRKLPLVPVAIASLTSASPALLPLAIGAGAGKLWPLFLSTALVIFAREVMKDLDDKTVDGGYKWTIPLALGERRSRIVAAGAVFSAVIAAAKISLLVLPGAALAAIASIALLRGSEPLTVRNYLDTGMALVILTLITFG